MYLAGVLSCLVLATVTFGLVLVVTALALQIFGLTLALVQWPWIWP